MKDRLKSWPTWIAIAALVVFVVMQAAGIDITEPVNMLMSLFLPLLVAFGIINDPATREKLFANGEQFWWQSWAVWTSIAALLVYLVKLIFKLDISPVVNGLMDYLLPVLMAFGVINSPTAKTTL